jgi:ParB-like chromosome segregation protein Spo0J
VLKFHPLANLFPLLEGAEFADLVADIKANGLHEPITLYQDEILDGRNRYRACIDAKREPYFKTYEGADLVSFVISANLSRRHLSESQRAMIAAKLATLRDGQRADLVEGVPIGRASEMLNVGERSVARARKAIDHGVPELVHAVERGTLSVSAAADIASQSVDEQRDIVARGEREILRAAKQIRAEKSWVRQAERMAKLVAISNNNAPLSDRRFPVIYADPAWTFAEGTADPSRRVEKNHYPTLTVEQICALSVKDLATRDAILFLWTPSSHLPDALRVMQAWDFKFQASMVWVKDKIGMGTLGAESARAFAPRDPWGHAAPGTVGATRFGDRGTASRTQPQAR